MNDIQTSLLREKFIIRNANTSNASEHNIITALSNRMVITLTSARGSEETFVVRAQNMHVCVRMVAKILAAYQYKGSLINRATPFNWEGIWDSVYNTYERSYNPDSWIAIYYDGGILFEYGERHQLLDVIEGCEYTNDGAYELSATIKGMETMHDTHYRSERPDFLQILSDAKELAKNVQ